MLPVRVLFRLRILATALAALILLPVSLSQTTETVLHTFTYRADGGFPFAGLTPDAQGNLYGVSEYGGDPNEGVCCGVVFQLTPGDGNWTFHVLHTFVGGDFDGESPTGSVVFDKVGNLYGTAQTAGLGFCGVVYELSPSKSGEWTETILHSFNNYRIGEINDGCLPSSFLIFDEQGNLYGTSQQTGYGDCTTNAGCGTVFELSPAQNGKWTEKILHRFPEQGPGDGVNPYGGLVFDSAGNLWGTTLAGGTSNAGTVFELSPQPGGTWKEKIVLNFTVSNGYLPYSALTIDKSGNLYGTAYSGGKNGAGVIYQLSPQSGGDWTETLLHNFAACTANDCPDGLDPLGGLVLDVSGNLYGTATLGGAASEFCNPSLPNFLEGCGIVFKLSPKANGTWSYSIIHRFPGEAEGAYLSPDHLAIDSNGNIFGTAVAGGDINANTMCPDALPEVPGCGVVFELTP